MIDIKFKKLHDDVVLPYKSTKGSSCFDLIAHRIEKKESGLYKVRFGFVTEIPFGFEGKIYPRSSISKTGWILSNSVGIIDSDYRGEWLAFFSAISYSVKTRKISKESFLSPNPFPYNNGDRVAQVKFEPVLNVNAIETDELSETDRDQGGFGSTGK